MLTIFPDFREEGWHSMDLCADMLVKYAPAGMHLRFELPSYRKVFGYLPWRKTQNFDRWYNRWKVYPKHVKKLAGQSGFFHIVDHSYAHLTNYLPKGRVGVYCHDLDAFKCILTPDQEPRPDWFKKMMGSVFEGLKKARIIFCSTKITQEALLSLGHWSSDVIYVVPYGTTEEFKPTGPMEPGNYLLHVGSCIARKRIDVLVKAFSLICKKNDQIKLIQAGGNFSQDQRQQIKKLKLENRIEQRQNLSREDLARLYRGAKCLVVTSDAEGFGLPVIESLSCGTQVVASDIPVFREIGKTDIGYFIPGDPRACSESILKVLVSPVTLRDKPFGKWSWVEHAKRICGVYESIGDIR
jgi:glycosyltransferase involved in cell wall biosynthesis